MEIIIGEEISDYIRSLLNFKSTNSYRLEKNKPLNYLVGEMKRGKTVLFETSLGVIIFANKFRLGDLANSDWNRSWGRDGVDDLENVRSNLSPYFTFRDLCRVVVLDKEEIERYKTLRELKK